MYDQTSTDHWLNGFLRQNCEEGRKRLQEERKLWNFTDSENDLDLSGIFNFSQYEESNGHVGQDIPSSSGTQDSVVLNKIEETTQFKDDITIHENEKPTDRSSRLLTSTYSEGDGISIAGKRGKGVDNRENNNAHHKGESSHEYQTSPERSLEARKKAPTKDEISTGVEKRDDSHPTSVEEARPESRKAEWDFETQLVEVPGMDIVYSKQQLQHAINDFNCKAVQRERLRFKQTMKQIEETVNEVLEEVERLDSNFKLQRMSPDSYYERKSWNEVDILIVLENVSLDEFAIEDLKTPTGYAKIRLKTSAGTSDEETASAIPSSSSESGVTSSRHPLFQWATEMQPGEIYLSPKELSRVFAALVSRATGRILRNGSNLNRKCVSFTEEEASVPFIVNLIPTVACPQNWPLCAYWLKNHTKNWPTENAKDEVMLRGMHLVAIVTNKDSDFLWRISFCAARRHLLSSDCEGKTKCLRVLKVLLQNDLSRPKGLVPLHLDNIVLWASKKHWRKEEWAESMLSDRVLEILVALHKCLENRDCYNFFVPTMNLYSDLKPEVASMLAVKVKDVLLDLFKYLI
ncbi:protein mab-21-like 2 [Acropora palmata]|uniref:protein mab-21-like 2 n=1 Tax=Acropora palmata TaxID=6131 RepID=UPI003DA1385C